MFSFSDIQGHHDVKSALLQQIRGGKLHHAHLFLGKMGYGGFPIAMAFVRYLYCKNRTETDSCGQCSHCHKIEKLIHPDIHFAFPSFESKVLSSDLMERFRDIALGTNGLFDLKDWMLSNQKKNAKIRTGEFDVIIDHLSLASFEGGYKTQIVWMAENMDKESNKILKILEEPGPNTVFVLLAESSDRILPTVISRCNIHKINKLPTSILMDTLKKERPNCPEDSISKSLIFSDNDLIEARRYLDDMDNTFSLEDNLKKFLKGLILFDQRKFSNIKNIIEFSEEIADQHPTIQIKFLEYFLYFIRQLNLYKHLGKCEVSPSLEKAIEYFAPKLEIDQIQVWHDLIQEMTRSVERKANVKLSFVSLGIESGRLQNRDEFESILNAK